MIPCSDSLVIGVFELDVSVFKIIQKFVAPQRVPAIRARTRSASRQGSSVGCLGSQVRSFPHILAESQNVVEMACQFLHPHELFCVKII